MGHYDTQQVCLNGHQITDSVKKHPNGKKDFCNTCGAKTITTCQNCGAEIKGHYYTPGIVSMFSASIPSNCDSCGAEHPWTTASKSNATKAASSEAPSINDSIELIKLISQRFHMFARQMQNRHSNRSTLEFNDEYDVQDAFHAILKLHFDDVRAEEYVPSYAGSSSRIDFLIHDEEIAIEIKKTRNGLKDKEAGEQIAIDIQRYETHPKCKKLICFIYDPEGRIGNPTGIERDLTKKVNELQVITIVAPKGH